jgi:16S rRNA (cytosine1402-N4)-methyltransferase
MVHESVLMAEVVRELKIVPRGTFVDATLGGAGHALEVARRLDCGGLLIGIDRDEFAVRRSEQVLSSFKDKIKIFKANFCEINRILDDLGILEVDGVLMDLGVSSFQLDDTERGFSYNTDSFLDMRMSQDDRLTAYDVVNFYKEDKLREILYAYGEEKWAARIARFIVLQRSVEPIRTCFELVGVIKAAVPKGARKDGPHPAKRTFQAIRIEVNGELAVLEKAIEDFVGVLKSGARICVISFHSLEDRIVKNTFNRLSNPCDCPREFPVCVCGKKPVVEVVTKKPIRPCEAELSANHRARSAKLRVAEKI